MRKSIVQFLLILSITLALAPSCSKDENPVAPGDSDHAEAVGLVISTGNVELIRYEKGVVTGVLRVNKSELTNLLTITFIDNDGDLFQPDEEHSKLEWVVDNAEIADIVQQGNSSPWQFYISGIVSGQTSVVFKIFHGDHADFVSESIPIEVVQK